MIMKTTKKILLALSFVLSGAAIYSCDEPIQPGKDTEQEESSILCVTHGSEEWQIPSFSGSGIAGMINWGDGQNTSFSTGATHDYSAAGSHKVTFSLNGASSFEIPSLYGIEAIDITRF